MEHFVNPSSLRSCRTPDWVSPIGGEILRLAYNLDPDSILAAIKYRSAGVLE